jgi:branched-chain amino acid transport system substrate-binding protein
LLKYYEQVGVKGTTKWYQRGTMNFAAIATRVMSGNPDAVELGPIPPGEATVFVKQTREAGYKGVFGRMGTGSEQIIKGLGSLDNIGPSIGSKRSPRRIQESSGSIAITSA